MVRQTPLILLYKYIDYLVVTIFMCNGEAPVTEYKVV